MTNPTPEDPHRTAGLSLVFLGSLVFLVFVVYGPALNRFFAGDHLWYFLELNGSRSFWHGLSFYDYGLSREYLKGDQLLFRPLYFAWLATLNSLFHYDAFAWNLTHLGLHVAVCFLLYLVLRRQCPLLFAWLLALLFAVMNAHIEMVLWNHIGGYLIAFALFLLGFLSLECVLEDDSASVSQAKWVTVYLFVMILGVFLYELLIPAATLMTGYYYWRRKRQGAALSRSSLLILCVPWCLYLAIYAVRSAGADRLFWVDDHGGTRAGLFARMAATAGHWFAAALFPGTYDYFIFPGERINRLASFNVTANAAAAVIYVLLIGGLWKGLSVSRLQRQAPALVLFVALLMAYLLLICLGRTLADIVTISYYLYFVCLAGILLVAHLVDFQKVNGISRQLAACALLVLIAWNAALCQRHCSVMRERNAPLVAHFEELSTFVRVHEPKPDFSFAVHEDVPTWVDPIVPAIKGFPDQPEAEFPIRVTEILYFRHVNKQKPKYLFPTTG